jgi:putative FmdB family regulatory protein
MPTYTYRCQKCGEEQDVMHGIGEEKIVNCKACSARAERIISPPAGIIFRGSGFHSTDYGPHGRK